ncbi:MAG TPA: hypothetical protein VF614_08215 [Chthoniobacteraceae bacterium]|jgi:uncharacterized coiled-coil protein SlyX
MAKALLLLSVVLMLVTAGLGFATKGKISTLQGNLSETRQNLTAATASANSAKAAQKRAEEDLTAAKTTIEERETALAAQKAEMQTLTTSLADAKTAADASAKQVTDLEAKLASMTTGNSTNPDPTLVNPLQADLDRTKAELAEARQVQETLNARATEAEGKLAGVERQVQEYKTNYVQPGLQGRVLAYNPGWNFVVLNIGDRQGLKANTSMIVVRNGQQVARLRVTSVEPTQAIADVIPGSLPRGGTVQPGDTVVHQGVRR